MWIGILLVVPQLGKLWIRYSAPESNPNQKENTGRIRIQGNPSQRFSGVPLTKFVIILIFFLNLIFQTSFYCRSRRRSPSPYMGRRSPPPPYIRGGGRRRSPSPCMMRRRSPSPYAMRRRSPSPYSRRGGGRLSPPPPPPGAYYRNYSPPSSSSRKYIH